MTEIGTQVRIHDSPSRASVGRSSDEIGQPGIWAGVVMQKLHLNAEKIVLLTDGATD